MLRWRYLRSMTIPTKGEIMNIILRRVALLGVVLILAVGIASAQAELRPGANAPSKCPCFNQADIWAIPMPYWQCAIDFQAVPGRDTLTTNLIYVQGIGAEAKVSEDNKSGYCAYVDYEDPLQTWVSFEDLKYKEALACREMIVNVIYANVAYCESFCEGDDCDDD